MANFSQGSRTRIGFVEETEPGVTPDTPTLQILPIRSFDGNITKERVQGEDIEFDRMSRIDRHGNRQSGGPMEVDLRKDNYDPFLESAFFSEFVEEAGEPDTMKVGTTLKTFTMEDAAQDIDQYRILRGMAVSSASFSVANNQMVQTTFEMVGLGGEQQQSTISSSPATPPVSNSPFDSYTGSIFAGGNDPADRLGVVSSFNFSIENSIEPIFVLGSAEAVQHQFGRAVVEGTIEAHYKDALLIDKFLNEMESSLRIVFGAPNDPMTYAFTFPRVKVNEASVPLSDEQSRLINISFVALFDETAETNLILTKEDTS